jgi:hypothetical protein
MLNKTRVRYKERIKYKSEKGGVWCSGFLSVHQGTQSPVLPSSSTGSTALLSLERGTGYQYRTVRTVVHHGSYRWRTPKKKKTKVRTTVP